MTSNKLTTVILGLSITSSWGNGHATTFRGLIRELKRKGHSITFLERDVPWYAAHRDWSDYPYADVILYQDLDELSKKQGALLREAHLVIVGSYVPEGVEVGRLVMELATGVTAFYDIDTPVTLAKMERQDYEYLHPDLIPLYDMYLSFTGGPTLNRLEETYGSPMARPFYCSFDPDLYYYQNLPRKWEMGYLGTYSPDRQPALENLMLSAASALPDKKFVVAGSLYPETVSWPDNVEHIEHLPPAEHSKFYCSLRYALNITRQDMIRAGYSPSVRLFEAAACQTPIISDYWDGLEMFFEPRKEILVSHKPEDTLHYLSSVSEGTRQEISRRARQKVLQFHTAAHRAKELENYYLEAAALKRKRGGKT